MKSNLTRLTENKTILGFAGRQRAGKTTISEYLKEHRGAEIITVASALKNLVCEMFNCDIDTLNTRKNDYTPIHEAFPLSKTSAWLNETVELIEREINVPAETTEEVFQKFDSTTTVRDVLQNVGTEIIRKYNPMWHVNKLVENIQNTDSNLVVVDDIRFPNEREAVERLGGQVFFVIRPDLRIKVSQHSSETSLFWQDFDSKHVLINYATEQFFCEQFTEMYDDHFFLAASTPILQHYFDSINDTNDHFSPYIQNNSRVYRKIVEIVHSSLIEHNGVFLYHSNSNETSNKIAEFIYKRQPHINNDHHTFVVWNPMIIENFKRCM